MPRPLELLDRGVALFERHLVAVDGPQWSSATPCTEWTVRDLAGHVVAGNELAVAVLTGRSGASRPAGPDDVLDAFRDTARDQRDAFARTDPDAVVAHPAGELRAAQFAVHRCADVVVHAWDLARALGGDLDLDLGSVLVEEVLDPYVRWVATLSVAGMYAPASSPGRSPSRQDGLLARLGRDPVG